MGAASEFGIEVVIRALQNRRRSAEALPVGILQRNRNRLECSNGTPEDLRGSRYTRPLYDFIREI